MNGTEALNDVRREVKGLARMLAKCAAGKVPLQLALRYAVSQAATVSEYAAEVFKMVTDWTVEPSKRGRKKKADDSGNGDETTPAPSPDNSTAPPSRKRGQGTPQPS